MTLPATSASWAWTLRRRSACGRRPLKRLAFVLLLAGFGLVAIIVAQLARLEPPPRATDSAVGIVLDVRGPDLARVASFVLRTADGQQLTFEVEALALDRSGKPAPHLREHLASGEPIEVDYYRDDCCDRLVAVRYRDAP